MDPRQCSQCTRACEDDVIGGDLLELARTSPACIMGAARLTRHARHLRSRGELSGGGQHAALLERSRHMIRQHMHVTDDEKIAMMDDFECELQYDGRCCAACGVRDAELVYTELVLHTVDGGVKMELLSPRRKSVTFAMPGWLRVNIKEVARLGKIRAQVFMEHDRAPGAFVKVPISALQLRYITRLAVDGGDAVDVHLVEEALHVRAGGRVGFSVCSACVGSFCADTERHPARAPALSMAAHDYGRRYLSPSTVRALLIRREPGAELLPPRLAGLDPAYWRLPIASELETRLLARTYLHVLSLSVAISGVDQDGAHATMSTHTAYFPLSLLSADGRRACRPWCNAADAKDALTIAMEQVQLVFVGPDSKFDRLKRAALSALQLRLRPKVVYTLLCLRYMAAQVRGDPDDRILAPNPNFLSELESTLSRDALSGCITRDTVWQRAAAPGGADTESSDVAGVRSDRGGAGASVKEPVAGCTDSGDGVPDVMTAMCRLLRRDPVMADDYRGQPACLLEAHFPLFPLGQGLPLDKKLSRARVRHMMLFHDCRFATELELVFGMADTTVRHLVNEKVSMMARRAPAAIAKIEALLGDSTLSGRLRKACLDPLGADAVLLMKQVLPCVNMSARSTPYTDARRMSFQATILAHHRLMGPSSHFVSVAPDDVRDLNAIRDSRPFRRAGKFPHVEDVQGLQEEVSRLRQGTGSYTQRALWRRVTHNPVSATAHFHRRVTIMNRVLLGIDPSARKTAPFATRPKGALGRLRSGAAVKECNGRHSQHLHMLTFGSVMPRFVSLVAEEPVLRELVLAALDTQMSAELPWSHHMVDRIRQLLHMRKAPLAVAGNGVCNDGRALDRRERAFGQRGHPGLRAVKVARLRERAHAVVRDYNRHRHCGSCRKGKKGSTGCRFTVPYVHGIRKSRCIQLRKNTRPEVDLCLDDVRWCGACVAGGKARTEPFTANERQKVKAWVQARGLDYEAVDVGPAPSRASLLEGGDGVGSLRQLLGADSRCLAVELQRRCPPDGAPGAAPASVDEMLGLLRTAIDSDESLHSASFTSVEVERGLGSDDGLEWMREQCTAAHCDNGSVAQFCEVVSASMECNTAIYHLGAGANATAASAYLAKYESKPQFDLKHDLLVVITAAHGHVSDHPSRAADSGTPARTAKYLVQRILNTGVERSATEAAMINLGQDAEVTVDSPMYLDVWGLALEAGAPLGRAEESDEEDDAQSDVRARHGLPGDTGGRRSPSTRLFVPSKDVGPIWVPQSKDYLYRPVELRHLNALEFFGLYELTKRAAPSRRSGSNPRGAGRAKQRRVDLLPDHPLAAHYHLVRRSKFAMPVMVGGRAPRRPSATTENAAARGAVWAGYYAALLIPWGVVRPGVSGDGHFRPRLCLSSLKRWWVALETESLHLATQVALQDAAAHAAGGSRATGGASAQRTGGGAASSAVSSAMADPALWTQRVSELGQARPATTAARRPPWSPDHRQLLLLRRDIFEFRLFVLENVCGAFVADVATVDLGNAHRSQSRHFWNEVHCPPEDKSAWGDDDVFDALREERMNRDLRESRRNGAVLRRNLQRATVNDALTVALCNQLVAGGAVSSDAGAGQVPPPSPVGTADDAAAADDAASASEAGAAVGSEESMVATAVDAVASAAAPRSSAGRQWFGRRRPHGLPAKQCERAFAQLGQKAAVRPAAVSRRPARPTRVNPFEEGAPSVNGRRLHAAQRAIGRCFLQRLRSRSTLSASSSGSAPLLCMGAAGCGKSTVIHELLRQILDEQLGPVCVTGYTGVSCTPFLSPTLLTMCNLSVRNLGDDARPTGTQLIKFADRFRMTTGCSVTDLAGLIVDEVSFITAEVLGRVSRLFQYARGRVGEPMGGVALLLTGHLAQLPPVGAPGTWFLDVLNETRRARGDSDVAPREPREQSHNFQTGVALLRSATRFDLTHNYRAHLDPRFARCLVGLCNPASDASVTGFLQKLRRFDPREARTRFGPFATLSNATRHAINMHKILEYGRLHRVPVFRWRWMTSMATRVPDDVYESEPSLWGYFCEGAPVQITASVNPARGVANGTIATLVALRFTGAVPPAVRAALAKSGEFDDGVVTVDRQALAGVVLQVSKGSWHGVPLPEKVGAVLPRLGGDDSGLVALPLVYGRRQEVALTSVHAALHHVTKVMKHPCSYELAFALTDYKLQGMTLQQLVVVIGAHQHPLRHTLSSLYVLLSRPQSSDGLRILEGECGAVEGLAGASMMQREELVVFERCYDRRGRYSSQLALAAYDALAQRGGV